MRIFSSAEYFLRVARRMSLTTFSYLIALPATYLRRCGGFVTSVQVFDLPHVYDAAIPAQSRAT